MKKKSSLVVKKPRKKITNIRKQIRTLTQSLNRLVNVVIEMDSGNKSYFNRTSHAINTLYAVVRDARFREAYKNSSRKLDEYYINEYEVEVREFLAKKDSKNVS